MDSQTRIELIASATFIATEIQHRLLKKFKKELTPEQSATWGKIIAIWSGIIVTTVLYFTGYEQTDLIRIVFEGISGTLGAVGIHSLFGKVLLNYGENKVRKIFNK